MPNTLLKELSEKRQNLKYFHIFSAIYSATILISIIVSARLIPLKLPFTSFEILVTGGTWTIPITFFIQDITTEVYGYKKSKQLVFLAISIVCVYIGYLKLTTYFEAPAINNIVDSYNEVFNALPRHLLALLAALTIGTLVNNYLLSKLKVYLKGKYLPFRFIGSTAVGEAVLQLTGTTIAWIGSLHFSTEIIPFVIFSYLYKIAFEAFMTPVNLHLCRWLKNAEGLDVYDY